MRRLLPERPFLNLKFVPILRPSLHGDQIPAEFELPKRKRSRQLVGQFAETQAT